MSFHTARVKSAVFSPSEGRPLYTPLADQKRTFDDRRLVPGTAESELLDHECRLGADAVEKTGGRGTAQQLGQALLRDHNGNLADGSAGLTGPMGVGKLVKRIGHSGLGRYLAFGDPLHQ